MFGGLGYKNRVLHLNALILPIKKQLFHTAIARYAKPKTSGQYYEKMVIIY